MSLGSDSLRVSYSNRDGIELGIVLSSLSLNLTDLACSEAVGRLNISAAVSLLLVVLKTPITNVSNSVDPVNPDKSISMPALTTEVVV